METTSTGVDQAKIDRITAEVLAEIGALGGGSANADARPTAVIRPYGASVGPKPELEAQAATARIPRIAGASLRPDELGQSPGGLPTVTCNVSNRHIHLHKEDFETLFGPGAELEPRNELMQPGQFAASQTLSLIAGRGRAIENVRILGPLRSYTQIEISRTDGFYLGIRPPVRLSGNTKGSAGGTLIGPNGTLVLAEGIIVADRHVHTPPAIARQFGLANNQMIRVRVFHTDKPTLLEQVRIRIADDVLLEMHIDNDDANAAGVVNGDRLELVV